MGIQGSVTEGGSLCGSKASARLISQDWVHITPAALLAMGNTGVEATCNVALRHTPA